MSFNKLFSVLRLIVKLSGQLMVLQNRKPGLCLQLFIVQSHQVRLSFFDLEIHLFCKLLYVFDLLELGFIDSDHALLLIVLELLLQLSNLSVECISFIRMLLIV